MFRIAYITVFCCLLVGCGTSSSELKTEMIKPTKVSSNKEDNDQQPSINAKEKVWNHGDITSVHAVNTSKDLVVAFEVNHLKRLQLEKTRKKIEKELKKEFPKKSVVVSTDKKIIIELEKLEAKVDTLSKKEFEKKVKSLIKLTKEET